MDSANNKTKETISTKKRKLEDSENDEINDVKIIKVDDESISKPMCKYGADCYRKNPDHLKDFLHSGSSGTNLKLNYISNNRTKNHLEKIEVKGSNLIENRSYFYLTKVSGIQNDQNYTRSIKG